VHTTAAAGQYGRRAPVIDLHTHILPAVDDGPRTLAEAVEMARAAAADGTAVVAATPHVREDWPTGPETMERRVGELREALASAGVDLDVLPGGEIALDRLDLLAPDELRRFGLAGNAGYLLLEFPYVGWPLGLEARVVELRSRGITPVIAHPERNSDVQADPERLRPAVLAGGLVQLTAASLDQRGGRRSRAAARTLLDRGLAHLLASDGHTAWIRSIGLRAAAAAVGDDALARWLTEGVPGAIVHGGPIPERPRTRPRRGRRFSRR